MTTNPFTRETIGNVFCATGKGGGVDPTCGKSGGGGGGGTMSLSEEREGARIGKARDSSLQKEGRWEMELVGLEK